MLSDIGLPSKIELVEKETILIYSYLLELFSILVGVLRKHRFIRLYGTMT